MNEDQKQENTDQDKKVDEPPKTEQKEVVVQIVNE